jgi:hypothetical protein
MPSRRESPPGPAGRLYASVREMRPSRSSSSAAAYHSSEPRPGSGATVVSANASDGTSPCTELRGSAPASRCMCSTTRPAVSEHAANCHLRAVSTSSRAGRRGHARPRRGRERSADDAEEHRLEDERACRARISHAARGEGEARTEDGEERPEPVAEQEREERRAAPQAARAPAHGQHEEHRVVHDGREPAGGRQRGTPAAQRGRAYPMPAPMGGMYTGSHSAANLVPCTVSAVQMAMTKCSAVNPRMRSQRILRAPP